MEILNINESLSKQGMYKKEPETPKKGKYDNIFKKELVIDKIGTLTLADDILTLQQIQEAVDVGEEVVIATWWTEKHLKDYDYTHGIIPSKPQFFPEDLDILEFAYISVACNYTVAVSIYSELPILMKASEFSTITKDNVRVSGTLEFQVYRVSAKEEEKDPESRKKNIKNMQDEQKITRNDEEDEKLVKELRSFITMPDKNHVRYDDRPKLKIIANYDKVRKVYRRDKQTSINALVLADNLCEYDKTHWTFKRKGTETNYTEAHHLVPMAYQDGFDFSLDREQNIISLCSHCVVIVIIKYIMEKVQKKNLVNCMQKEKID